MKSNRLFALAHVAAGLAMFPSLLMDPRMMQGRQIMPRDVARKPYHRHGIDGVLMDWDLPKGKRAKRRRKARSKQTEHEG